MGILAVVLALLSLICMALGIVNILDVSSEPIFSANFTWSFWMSMATFLMLCTIAVILYGRGQNFRE
jgi:hypothetical protein